MEGDGVTVYQSLPAGIPDWYRDADANDSDKTYTVPEGHTWQVLFIEGDLLATATVGNRQLEISISDESPAVVYVAAITANTTASQRTTCQAGVGTYGDAPAANSNKLNLGLIAVNTSMFDALPNPCFLPGGYSIRIRDRNAVDAAADDLTVVIYYIDYLTGRA